MYSLNGAESCNSTFNNQHSTLLIRLLVCKYVITHYQVVIAVRSHLFPFRTEKLSSLAPMVLQCGRVGSRLLSSRASDFERFLRLFCFLSLILSCIICFLEILCSFMKKNERKTCSYNIFYYFCSQIHKTLNN